MDATAARRTKLAINCTKRVRVAGAARTAGGMNTSIVGAPTATGMITITIAKTANIRRAKSAIERS